MTNDNSDIDDFSVIENLLNVNKKSQPKTLENLDIVKIPEARCPFCEAPINASGEAYGRATPSPKDFAICVECAEVLVFDDKLVCQKPDFDDWIRIQQDKSLEQAIEGAQAQIRRQKRT